MRARRCLDVPHVAVFDTAFHRTMPPAASTYAVPQRWREEWDVHRYGFHGISVQWVSSQIDVRAARRLPSRRRLLRDRGQGRTGRSTRRWDSRRSRGCR